MPILDEPLGQAFQPIADAIVEVPVLTDCQAEAPCERGYWVVMRSRSKSAPDYFDPRWTATPGMGRYSWTATAQTLADPDDPAAAAPELRVNDGPADLAPVPAVETQAVTVPLTPNVDRIIDATISIPERPSVSGGLDPLEAALAVVHWTGFGMSVASHLEGPGTDAQSGGASAGGSANLIAHPFAACPPSGPCEVTTPARVPTDARRAHSDQRRPGKHLEAEPGRGPGVDDGRVQRADRPRDSRIRHRRTPGRCLSPSCWAAWWHSCWPAGRVSGDDARADILTASSTTLELIAPD